MRWIVNIPGALDLMAMDQRSATVRWLQPGDLTPHSTIDEMPKNLTRAICCLLASIAPSIEERSRFLSRCQGVRNLVRDDFH